MREKEREKEGDQTNRKREGANRKRKRQATEDMMSDKKTEEVRDCSNPYCPQGQLFYESLRSNAR